MLQAQTKSIGENTYTVTQLKASKGLSMLVDLSKIIGPSLGMLFDGAGADGKINLKALGEMQIKGDVIGKAVEALALRLDSAKVQAMVAELAAVTTVDVGGCGKSVPLPGVYEMHFAGKIGELFSWLRFALEVQYSDFFSSFLSQNPQG